LKSDPGRLGLESLLEEIVKLRRARALGLPADLFGGYSDMNRAAVAVARGDHAILNAFRPAGQPSPPRARQRPAGPRIWPETANPDHGMSLRRRQRRS
jgi:hypothetical protein